jgi:hypothetical protein
MRSITTLQHLEKTSLNSPLGNIEVPLFDLTPYEKPSKALHHYDLDNQGTDDGLERYKPCQPSNTSNSSAASVASAPPLPGGTAIASSPPATVISMKMRSLSIAPTSPTCQSTETSAPTALSEESSTSSPAGFPVPELAGQESEPDSLIPNPHYGEKDCESWQPSDLDISSGNNLWELSNEDYEQSLEDVEWQDILAGLSESVPMSLGLATGANESSLLIPTLTTGSGSYRDAGQTKCEQRLKQLGVIPPGCQFSPEGMAALMGFPLDWFAALTGERLRGMSTVLTTDSPNVPTCDDLLGDALPPLKLELLSPLPCSEGELLSNVENDSLRNCAPVLTESISPELGSETEFSQEISQQSPPDHEYESSRRSREKLRSLADSLSEEGLRQLVRDLSELLGDDSLLDVDRVLDESSFDYQMVALNETSRCLLPDVEEAALGGSHIASVSKSDSVGSCSSACYGCDDSERESLPPSEQATEKGKQGRRAEPALTSSSVATYTPGGQARGGNEYFRLTWWENGKSRHKHIRGGNIRKPSVLSRVRKIIDAIAQKWSFSDVLALC